MDKNIVKQAIEALEYYRNGFNKLWGVEVYARNVKLLKDKAVADIIIRWFEEGKQERYNACEYPYEDLRVKELEAISR